VDGYDSGFLTDKEAGAFPLIKMYPAGHKDKSVEWPEVTVLSFLLVLHLKLTE
jgi:hypothetical protein